MPQLILSRGESKESARPGRSSSLVKAATSTLPAPRPRAHASRQLFAADTSDIALLQKTFGNHAVQRLFSHSSHNETASPIAASPARSTTNRAAQADVPAEAIWQAAHEGRRTPPTRMPFAEQIQQSFGRHDISHIQAHTGAAATRSAATMQATAYALGEHVVFAGRPSLHTAAHEAAHVVQQRGGVQLSGNLGRVGDAYEEHAEQVAARVVSGQSAESLLDRFAAPQAQASGVHLSQPSIAPASAATQALQRKLGLEFQTGVQVFAGQDEDFEEGEKIAEGDGWYIVADEVKHGQTGVLEFVTEPFDDEEPLIAAVEEIQGIGEEINENKAIGIVPERSPLSDFVMDAPDDIALERPRVGDDVSAAPQATYDVPLERVTRLLLDMEKPQLGEEFGGEAGDERTWSLSGEAPEEAEVLVNSAKLVEGWFSRNVVKSGRYRKLMGLASLLLSYIINAARQSSSRPLPYAKLIAPVMSRYSFSSIWRQLDKEERALFAGKVRVPELKEEEAETFLIDLDEEEETSDTESVSDTEEETTVAENFQRWMEDLARLYAQQFKVGHKEQPGELLFPGGYLHEVTGRKVAGVKTGDWLQSIVEQERDLLSPPVGGSKSMGKYEATAPSAMVELRRMPKSLPVSAWTMFASRVFKLYQSLIEEKPAKRARASARRQTQKQRETQRRAARDRKYAPQED